MEITSIKTQLKNEGRVSVFLDGKYSFSLTLDQLLDQKLKKGEMVDELRLSQLKKMSDEGKLRARALEWLMMRPHSIREFQDYLYRKKADKDLIAALVDEFTDKKYLDEAAFAKWFSEARRRKNKSDRAITAELRSKGIPTAQIDAVLNVLVDNEDGALKELIKKLRTRPRYADEQKLMRYLISKGFNYSAISEAMKENPLA